VTRTEHLPGINHLIGQLCRRHFERANSLLTQIGVYRGQPPLLHALWDDDGLPQATLSAQLGISAATVSKMVQRMERAGLVQRREDPADGRLSRVYLTQEGWAVRERVHAIWIELADAMLRGFSEDEIQALQGMLVRLFENLGQGGGDVPPGD
jgi:DNA-binding MarR family transcriptional regulator